MCALKCCAVMVVKLNELSAARKMSHALNLFFVVAVFPFVIFFMARSFTAFAGRNFLVRCVRVRVRERERDNLVSE